MAMGPAFMSWFSAQSASMGMSIQDLGDHLTYLNRNGQIDDYFATVKDRFDNEVQITKTVLGTYYKTTATFWQDLFTGGNGITGVKEMWAGSTDPESPWYLDPADNGIFYKDLAFKIYEGTDFSSYYNSLTNQQKRDLFISDGVSSITIGADVYTSNYSGGDVYWRMNGNVLYYKSCYAADLYGFIPTLVWINAGGALDANGYKYKSQLQEVGNSIYSPYFVYGGVKLIDSTVAPSEVETVVPFVMPDLSAYTLTDEQVQSDDYVGVLVPESFSIDMETALGAIGDGHVTLEETVLTLPQITDLDIETDNTAIQDITGAQAVAEVAVPDFPQVERFKMPTGITSKFPFSIPWDLRNAVLMMQQDAVIPVFTIPFVIDSINFDDEIVIDLTQFELLAKITRWFVLAIFIIGLILVTRQLIKG